MTTAPGDQIATSVAVTGLSVLTPLGDSIISFEAALRAGRREIDALDEWGGIGESRIDDFDATRYANVRGMRIYNRATRLGICAAKLALVDSGLPTASLPAEEIGVVTASTFGHLDTLIEYDRSLVTAGLQRTNPALMPLAIPSAPGAIVALSLGAKAFSITLSDGGASSLDAVGLGARLLQAGRARACVVVGAFAICRELVVSAYRAGIMAPATAFRVFDRRSQGMVFGEGAAALVLERRTDALERGAVARGMILGQASTFAARESDVEHGLRRASETALRAAGVTPAEIGLVSSGASGLPNGDRAEALALLAVLGDTASGTPVIATKANLGDTIDASGLLQSVVALSALRLGRAPPIVKLDEPAVPGLRYLREETPVDCQYALVTSTSIAGACSALVFSARRDS